MAATAVWKDGGAGNGGVGAIDDLSGPGDTWRLSPSQSFSDILSS